MGKYVAAKQYKSSRRNCWSCKFQLHDESTLFGVCSWFSDHGRQNKDIPKEIVDIGCKFYLGKVPSSSGELEL